MATQLTVHLDFKSADCYLAYHTAVDLASRYNLDLRLKLYPSTS